MVNILLAVRLFAGHWSGKNILIKCDNQAVVMVLSPEKPVTLTTQLVPGTFGTVQLRMILIYVIHTSKAWPAMLQAYFLRWKGSPRDWSVLHAYVPNPCWLSVMQDMLYLDPEL